MVIFMNGFENSNLHISEKTARELEDIILGLESNILKTSDEYEALLMQAYSSDAGSMLCEKYHELVQNISSVGDELKVHCDTIKNEKKHIL